MTTSGPDRRTRALLVSVLLAGTWQASPCLGQEANVLFSQDFERVKGGTPPLPICDNSGWAGSTVPLRVVDSGDPRFGNVLQAEVNGFAQLMLGTIRGIGKGRIYRIALDAASKGVQRPEVFLRMGPSPYRVYMTSTETTNESMTRLSYIGKSLHDDERQVVLMLRMNGVTTLRLDNIRVEQVVGALPKGAPPVPGNSVPNASFENGRDGWFVRGNIDFADLDTAPDGGRTARLAGKSVLSTSWLRLSQQADYQLRVRACAEAGTADLRVGFSNYVFPRGGSAGKSERARLRPEQGWQTVSLRWRPPASAGKITEWAEYFVNVENPGSADGVLLVDAVEVRAVLPGVDLSLFEPAAPVELALFTNMPQNVATRGEAVDVTVRSTGPLDQVHLRILDEQERETGTVPVVLPDGRCGSVTLSDLPCGYWRLLAEPVGQRADVAAGETLLAVVPAMPDIRVEQWTYGAHVPIDPAIRRACWKVGLRVDRLHDTGKETKWHVVQPEAESWRFADESIDARRASGHLLVGSIAEIPGWAPRAKTHPTTGKPLPEGHRRGNVGMTGETFPFWEEYARRCAERWRGRIDIWEITNEPNLSGMGPGDYVQLFDAAARGIRQGNPDATIVSLGGATPPGSKWIREAIEAGAVKQADAVSFHGYGNTTWSCIPGPESLVASVRDLKGLLRVAGKPNLAVWDSECGVEVQTWFRRSYVPHGGDPMAAARMFPKSVAAVRAAGLARVCYYSATGTTHAGDAGLRCFSDFNGVMKITVVPLAVAISLLEGAEFVERRAGSADEGIVDLTFRGRGRRVRMLWSLSGDCEAVVPAGARFVSMWGRDVPRGTPLPGGLGVTLTPEPLYVLYPAD